MSKRKYTIKPRFVLFLNVLMLFLFAIIFMGERAFIRRQEATIAQLEQQTTEIAQQNETLEGQIDFTETTDYVERVAREELGLMKPGEVRYMTINP